MSSSLRRKPTILLLFASKRRVSTALALSLVCITELAVEAMQDELEDERIIQLRPRAEWNPKDGQQNLRLLRVHTGQGLADDDEMYGPDRVGADSVLDTSASPNMVRPPLPALERMSRNVQLGAVACLFNYYRRHPPSGRLVEPERGIAEVSSVERIALCALLSSSRLALIQEQR